MLKLIVCRSDDRSEPKWNTVGDSGEIRSGLCNALLTDSHAEFLTVRKIHSITQLTA